MSVVQSLNLFTVCLLVTAANATATGTVILITKLSLCARVLNFANVYLLAMLEAGMFLTVSVSLCVCPGKISKAAGQKLV